MQNYEDLAHTFVYAGGWEGLGWMAKNLPNFFQKGRTNSSQDDPKCSEGAGCFELLAAVAGQFFEDSGSNAKHFFSKISECECNQESTFGADETDKDSMISKIQSGSNQFLVISKGDVEGEVEVHNFYPKDSIQAKSVHRKPLATKISQKEALGTILGYSDFYLGDALPQGCRAKCEGGKGVRPVAVVEDDGFSAKSDNESNNASADCKERAAWQKQAGGRGNLCFEKQEPCRINQIAHEYSLKDARPPEFRILNEDVLSNEMMIEQEADFEEECSKLNRLAYVHGDAVEAVREIPAIEGTEVRKCFPKLEQKKRSPGGGLGPFFPERMHVDKDKKTSHLPHHEYTSKCPKPFSKIKDDGIDDLPLTGSLVPKEQMQRIYDNESKFLDEKTSHSKRETSSFLTLKFKAKKCDRLRNANGYGGSGSGCSKRKHVEMEFPGATGERSVQQFLCGENAHRRRRSSRVSKFRRKSTGEKEDIVPSFPLPYKHFPSPNYQYVNAEPPAAAAKLHRAQAVNIASSPTKRGAFPTTKSSEPHVKVSIKSFTVPELLVNLPESATVASLKKAVMDAAMKVLGGGLRVRVLLQGKKVLDEDATLVQLGVSPTVKSESLSFMLEPAPSSSVSSNFDDPLLLLSHAASLPSSRCATSRHHGLGYEEKGWPSITKLLGTKSGSDVTVSASVPCSNEITFEAATLIGEEAGTNEESSKCQNDRELQPAANERAPLEDATIGAMIALREQTNSLLCPKHESESASTLSDVTPLSAHDAGAILLHSRESHREMAIVSMPQNNLLQAGKRRIRRPFSVGEVEALVLAVEKVGTGRWRDIKCMAFYQAKHRTYVDLKDKWKTLVHTAQIPPHHRRGEPVPQELLERVMSANSHWASRQRKQ